MKRSLGRVAIYARFSSDKQKDASIEDQVRIANELIEREGGAQLVEVYADFARSAKELDRRPQAMALLAAIKKDKFDTLISEAVDRIARDEEHAHHIRKLCSKHKVALICVDGTRLDDNNPSGRLAFSIKAAFAEDFRHVLSAKTKRGKAGVALKGRSNGGLPFGYTSDEAGHIIVDPAKSEVVQRIFYDAANGKTMTRIARNLNAEAAPTPRRGKPWSTSTVQTLLKCVKYAGRWSYADVVPETFRSELMIVEPTAFEKIKKQFEARAGRTFSEARRGHMLSGILHCGACGARMISAGGSGPFDRYFGCANYRSGAGCGNHRKVRLNHFQPELIRAIRETMAASEDTIKVMVAEELAAWKTTRRPTERAKLAQELRAAENKLGNLIDAVASLGNSPALTKKIKAAEEIAAALKERLALSETGPAAMPTVEELLGRVMRLEGLVIAGDVEVARSQLQALLKHEKVLVKPSAKGFQVSCDLVFDTHEYVLANSRVSKWLLPVRFLIPARFRRWLASR